MKEESTKVSRFICGNGEGMFQDDNGEWVIVLDVLKWIEGRCKEVFYEAGESYDEKVNIEKAAKLSAFHEVVDYLLNSDKNPERSATQQKPNSSTEPLSPNSPQNNTFKEQLEKEADDFAEKIYENLGAYDWPTSRAREWIFDNYILPLHSQIRELEEEGKKDTETMLTLIRENEILEEENKKLKQNL